MNSIDRLFSLCEFNDFRNVQDFFRVLNDYDYRIVGGLAVAYYVKKRVPSKGDIDVIIDAKDFRHIAEDLWEDEWKVFRKGFRAVFEYAQAKKRGDEFDILIDDMGIMKKSKYRIASFRGIEVKIMEPEWIIPLKLLAGRDKDIQDIVFLLQTEIDMNKVKGAVEQVLGEEGMDELQSLIYLAKADKRFLEQTRWFEERFEK